MIIILIIVFSIVININSSNSDTGTVKQSFAFKVIPPFSTNDFTYFSYILVCINFSFNFSLLFNKQNDVNKNNGVVGSSGKNIPIKPSTNPHLFL